jgi:hypothetical protein
MAISKAKPTRLYAVKNINEGHPLALIEATNAAQARHAYSRKSVTVEYASQADIIAATKAGIDVEQAVEADGE